MYRAIPLFSVCDCSSVTGVPGTFAEGIANEQGRSHSGVRALCAGVPGGRPRHDRLVGAVPARLHRGRQGQRTGPMAVRAVGVAGGEGLAHEHRHGLRGGRDQRDQGACGAEALHRACVGTAARSRTSLRSMPGPGRTTAGRCSPSRTLRYRTEAAFQTEPKAGERHGAKSEPGHARRHRPGAGAAVL